MPKVAKKSCGRLSMVLGRAVVGRKLPVNDRLQNRPKARSQQNNTVTMLRSTATSVNHHQIWKILSKKQTSASPTGRLDYMEDDLARAADLSKIGYTLPKLAEVLPNNPATDSKLQISTGALRILLGVSSLKSGHDDQLESKSELDSEPDSEHFAKTPGVVTHDLNIALIEGLHAINLCLYDLRVFFEPIQQHGNGNLLASKHDSPPKSPSVHSTNDIDPTHCNPKVWSQIPFDNTGNQLKQHIRMHSTDGRVWNEEVLRCDPKNKKKESICFLKSLSGGRTLAARKNDSERYVVYANPDHNRQKRFLTTTLPLLIQAKNAECLNVNRDNKKRKKNERKMLPSLFDFVYETHAVGRFEITEDYPADDDIVQ